MKKKILRMYSITLLEFSLIIPRLCCKAGLHLQFLKYVCAPHQSPLAGNSFWKSIQAQGL